MTTEVLEKIDDLNPRGRVENNQILIEFDTRNRDYHKLLGLSRKTIIAWSYERTFDVQENVSIGLRHSGEKYRKRR